MKPIPAMMLALLLALPAQAAPRIFAVIVGNNQSLEPNLPALHYADDDAARYFELFRALGARVELFAVLDPASQERYPEATRAAKVPQREAVLAGVQRLHQEIAAGEPAESVLYFVFSGHGSVARSYEGYLHLLDARLTRGDLFREIVAPSPAAYNHLILDACQAYFLVASRGEDEPLPDFRAAVRAYLAAEDIARYPNTGFVLSSARDLETHEWAAYEAGVFSHELISALVGAADVDCDGRVGYPEARAFLTAANRDVKDPRARLAILARPPAKDIGQPLLDLGAFASGALLRLTAADAGRFSLQDDRGVRYADLNKAREGELVLRLVPRPQYYLRRSGEEARVPAQHSGAIEAAGLEWQTALAARGAVQDTLRQGLFAVPFGPTFYEGYVASIAGAALDISLIDGAALPEFPEKGQGSLRPWAWGTLGLAVAAAAGAGAAGILAENSFDEFRDRLNDTGLADADLMDEVDDRRTATNVLAAVAAASAAASLVLFLVEPRTEDDEPALQAAAPLRVAPCIGPGAAAVLLRFELP